MAVCVAAATLLRRFAWEPVPCLVGRAYAYGLGAAGEAGVAQGSRNPAR